MTTLHLGVVDLPYVDEPGVTTGDVAGWLENKYAVMQHFFSLHQNDIREYMQQSVEGALENIFLGAPVGDDPLKQALASAMGEIEKDFRINFLDADEMALLGFPDVPTKAALKGVSKRLKQKRGPPRPSFIDSGLYESSFKAWVE